MLARVLSAAVNGIEAFPVEMEVNSGWGDAVVVIVGLPDAVVKELRDRLLKPKPLCRFRRAALCRFHEFPSAIIG